MDRNRPQLLPRMWAVDLSSVAALPLFTVPVPAGFPSPADDYLEGTLDLNRYFIRNPAATFLFRVDGDSMRGACIQSGDVLIVDRSLEPRDGDIVVASLDGGFTVKRLRLDSAAGRVVLEAENPEYPPIPVTEDSAFEVWGTVRGVARRLNV